MSRKRYWLSAATPLAIALTTLAWAEGPQVELTDAVHYRGALVSLEATNVTLPDLARQLTETLGCEVRIEGTATGIVSLSAKEVTMAALLSQASAALGGRWAVLYRLSTQEPASTPPPPSGTVLNLKMPDVSCQAAAAVVARMAGGRLDRDGELIGQVSLTAEAMPVEDAMDTIARAAKASWRRIYVMNISSLPQASAPHGADPAPSRTAETPSGTERKRGPKQWSSHATSTGTPTKFTKRDWKNPSKRTFAPGVRGVQPTMEEMQKHAMMGLYGPLFLLDSEAGRETAMKNFKTGLETQLKRLQALPFSQRSITTMMTRRNFQRLLDDFASLDKDQKKEAQSLYDYAKEQLEKAPLKS